MRLSGRRPYPSFRITGSQGTFDGSLKLLLDGFLTYVPVGVQDVTVCLQRSLPSIRAPHVSGTTASPWSACCQEKVRRSTNIVRKAHLDDVARLRYDMIPNSRQDSAQLEPRMG